MKLVSYAFSCGDLRNARRMNEVRPGERGGELPCSPTAVSATEVAEEGTTAVAFKPTLMYPENVTAHNLLYFMVAPTLVYQVRLP